MRELTMVEMELVDGGNPILIGTLIGLGVISLAGMALLGYVVHERCTGSLTVSADSIEMSVSCPPPTLPPTGG